MEQLSSSSRVMEAANHSKNSAMEAENHVKHGARSKSQMSRGNFLRKARLGLTVVAVAFVLFLSSCGSPGTKAGKDLCNCLNKIDFDSDWEKQEYDCGRLFRHKYKKYLDESEKEFIDPQYRKDFDAVFQKCIESYKDKIRKDKI